METMKFKTNIKCSGCIDKVTPVLNKAAGADNWKVDLQSPEKVLTISADDINKEELNAALGKLGYHATKLD